MNHIILSSITREISRGRPLAALLMMNQQLERSDPLRVALLQRIKQRFEGNPSRYQPISSTVGRLVSGVTLSELSPSEAATVRGFREEQSQLPGERYIPHPVLLQTRQGQIQRLRRVGR